MLKDSIGDSIRKGNISSVHPAWIYTTVIAEGRVIGLDNLYGLYELGNRTVIKGCIVAVQGKLPPIPQRSWGTFIDELRKSGASDDLVDLIVFPHHVNVKSLKTYALVPASGKHIPHPSSLTPRERRDLSSF